MSTSSLAKPFASGEPARRPGEKCPRCDHKVIPVQTNAKTFVACSYKRCLYGVKPGSPLWRARIGTGAKPPA